MLSHGFLSNIVSRQNLEKFDIELKKFISCQKKLNSYYSNINKEIPNVLNLINSELLEKVMTLLNNDSPEICNIELHIQFKHSKGIPPHQDNFYHCINPTEGLKVLIPMQPMNNYKGSLTFLDCSVNYPVQEHIPSDVPNFSSAISFEKHKKLNLKSTCYEYKICDASYHFLNSIHFSNGNQTNKDILFVVFRFQKPKAKVDLVALSKYNECYQKHKNILNLKINSQKHGE